jgi:hypothetical protein
MGRVLDFLGSNEEKDLSGFGKKELQSDVNFSQTSVVAETLLSLVKHLYARIIMAITGITRISVLITHQAAFGS